MPAPKSPACGKPQAALLMCALKGGNPGYESAWRVTLESGWNHQKLARPQSAISSPPILFHPLGWRESQCPLEVIRVRIPWQRLLCGAWPRR